MSRPEPDPAGVEVVVNVAGDAVLPVDRVEDAVRRSLADDGTEQGQLSVTFLADDGIRTLNRDYLDRDRVTDVIAFTLDGSDGVLGDVYVGYEQAERQAAEEGVDYEVELVRLAIHGVLHVLGHDHPEGDDRADSPMFALQERLLGEVFPAQ